MGPGDLSHVLSRLMPSADPRLLVGPETLDDAAVVRLNDELAICFTADFITPLVDDPATWGHIAAANSLSDIYAMGATPLAALNLVCWPNCLPSEWLCAVMAGGAAAAEEANCLIVGGHTVDDKQPKYGLAVIGTVHPARILRNRGGQPGDLLYLTKPLGTGLLATAIKAGQASPDHISAVVESMKTLNRAASEAAVLAGARALTDVTGFGLAGHLLEMLGPDGRLGAKIKVHSLPALPGALDYIDQGFIPGGAYRNRDAYRDRVSYDERANPPFELLMYDPQTSGGLLAAIPPEAADRFEREAECRQVSLSRIGALHDRGGIEAR